MRKQERAKPVAPTLLFAIRHQHSSSALVHVCSGFCFPLPPSPSPAPPPTPAPTPQVSFPLLLPAYLALRTTIPLASPGSYSRDWMVVSLLCFPQALLIYLGALSMASLAAAMACGAAAAAALWLSTRWVGERSATWCVAAAFNTHTSKLALLQAQWHGARGTQPQSPCTNGYALDPCLAALALHPPPIPQSPNPPYTHAHCAATRTHRSAPERLPELSLGGQVALAPGLLAVMGFLVGVMWIDTVAGEVVAALSFLAGGWGCGAQVV